MRQRAVLSCPAVAVPRRLRPTPSALLHSCAQLTPVGHLTRRPKPAWHRYLRQKIESSGQVPTYPQRPQGATREESAALALPLVLH